MVILGETLTVGSSVGRLLGGEFSMLSPIITAPPLVLLSPASPDARVKLPPVLADEEPPRVSAPPIELPSSSRSKLPPLLVDDEPSRVSAPPIGLPSPDSRFKLPPLPLEDKPPFRVPAPPLALSSSDSRFKLPPLLVDEEPPSNEAPPLVLLSPEELLIVALNDPPLLPSPGPIEFALLAIPDADELLPRAKPFMLCSEDEGSEVASMLKNNGIIAPIVWQWMARQHIKGGLESSNQNIKSYNNSTYQLQPMTLLLSLGGYHPK